MFPAESLRCILRPCVFDSKVTNMRTSIRRTDLVSTSLFVKAKRQIYRSRWFETILEECLESGSSAGVSPRDTTGMLRGTGSHSAPMSGPLSSEAPRPQISRPTFEAKISSPKICSHNTNHHNIRRTGDIPIPKQFPRSREQRLDISNDQYSCGHNER